MTTEETRDVAEVLSNLTDADFMALCETLLKGGAPNYAKHVITEIKRRWELSREMVAVQQKTIHGLYLGTVIQVTETPDHSN